MGRKDDLEKDIRQSYDLIRQHEETLKLSDNPKEKARCRRAIKEQRGLIRDYLEEYLPRYNQSASDIPQDITEIMEGLPECKRLVGKVQLGHPILFKNRGDEIDRILSSFGEPYCLVDAPAGYGKSELLVELRKRFESQAPPWVCALTTRQNMQLQDLAIDLAKGLMLSRSLPKKSARQLGMSLANRLKLDWSENIRSRGVIILIDLGDSSSQSFAQDIVLRFVPGMWEGLRTLDFQSPRKQKPFRVILAGRHLARDLSPNVPDWKRMRLSPFDYKAVYETTRDYLVGHTEDDLSIRTLAAHILYLTGGHPGCMARLLRDFKEGGATPNEFVNQLIEQAKGETDTIVKPVIDQVYESISPDLQEAFVELCAFRCLEPNVLKAVLGAEHFLFQDQNEHDLADRLTKEQYLRRDRFLLRDDITRRLLAIRLHRSSATEFVQRCRTAKTLCEQQLAQPYDRCVPQWVVEYMFQSLQQHIGDILTLEGRNQVQKEFFERELPHILDTLTTGRDPRVQWPVLQQEFGEDWEFQFTLNYFLRQDEYTDGPYQRLVQEVGDYFAQKRR